MVLPSSADAKSEKEIKFLRVHLLTERTLEQVGFQFDLAYMFLQNPLSLSHGENHTYLYQNDPVHWGESSDHKRWFRKTFVFRQPAQFSQLLHLYHHLDPTLHSQIACRVGVFLLSLVCSNWGPPTLPLAECRTAEGSTAPSLLRERNSPGSELCLRVENGIMSCGLSKSTDWGKSKALTVFFLRLVSD